MDRGSVSQVTTRADAIAWYDAGFTPLVCVTPPDATLAPDSRIAPGARGKAPGKLRSDLTWGGYAWRSSEPTSEQVRQWVRDGANIGLNTEFFPSVDIDVTDPVIAKEIDSVARYVLGDAPCRTGRHPKRLLLYHTREPFTRGRMTMLSPDGMLTKHLIEVLGQGQQFVAFGTHPATRQEYLWTPALPATPTMLSEITASDVRLFLETVKERFTARGWQCSIDGAGSITDPSRSSDHLRAPSFTAVADAVQHIPNTSDAFPSRDSYLTMGYAIKAASGVEQEEDAFSVYMEWASRWQDGVNDPGTVRDDWRRFAPPYRVGWEWLTALAKQYGYDDASNDFAALEEVESLEPSPLFGTDHWLAEQMVKVLGRLLRYAPEMSRWYVWDGTRWEPDAMFKAEAMVNRELIVQASRVARMGATIEEKKKYYRIAENFLSSARASAVRKVMESNSALAIHVASFDSDAWRINTPGGMIDLRQGTLAPADSNALMSKTTSVAPEFDRDCPRWVQFLKETTGNDTDFIGYLQRYAGYCLTGLVNEQMLMYLWGGGGNGKSVFLNVLSAILHNYAVTAPGRVFTQSLVEQHPTELAMMAGARLVLASEVAYGKKWDGERIKMLTGGEKITARFMRQDDFTFMPTFKILIAGNARPAVANLDEAMRRRLHFVPFTRTPAVVDINLGEKLRAEHPAILAWMVRGCVAWSQHGLGSPAVVLASTETYFEDEDLIQEWMRACVRGGTMQAFTSSRALWTSWNTWCRQAGEQPGTERDLIQKLSSLGMYRARDNHGVRGFKGVRLLETMLADLL